MHAALLATASAAALLSTASLPQTRPALRRPAVWCRSPVPVASEGGPPTPDDIRWVRPIDPSAGDEEPADGCATQPATAFLLLARVPQYHKQVSHTSRSAHVVAERR